MASQADVVQAISHILQYTPNWRGSLNDADFAALDEAYKRGTDPSTWLLDKPVDDRLLQSLKDANPTLFDGVTGSAITPSSPRPPTTPAAGDTAPPTSPVDDGFAGKAADASKQVDDALAKSGTAISHADEELVDAVLGAKTGSDQAKTQLRTLQQSLIDEINKLGPTLDTPAGQQQLNDFLQGKTQEILNIAKSSDMDASSKADVLGALSQRYDALHRTSGAKGSDSSDGESAASPQSASAATDLGSTGSSGLTGSALSSDPLLNGLASDPLMGGLGALANPAMGALSSLPGMVGSMMPGLGGMGGGGLPLGDLGSTVGGAIRDATARPSGSDDLQSDATSPDSKLSEHGDAQTDPVSKAADLQPQSGSAADDKPDAAKPGGEQVQPVAAGSGVVDPKAGAAIPDVAVKLADGSTVIADDPRIAQAGRLYMQGASFDDAFSQAGIPQPPPGATISTPVSPSQLRFGDYAQYTDHRVMVVNRDKAWEHGQLVPLSEVPTGPNFLGWARPTTTPLSLNAPATASPGATVPAGT